MTTAVLSVIFHCRLTIVCGNGLTCATAIVLPSVGLEERLLNTNCGVTFQPQDNRQRSIDSELRARYDIVGFESIKRHVNIFEDPSTGEMLQTIQIV